MQIELEQINNFLKNKKDIIGCDCVGEGSWAGIIAACGVRAPLNWKLEGLNDSKKLSPKKREIMREQLLKLAEDKIIEYHIAERTNLQIDKMGLGVVLKEIYIELFKKLESKDTVLICDGNLKFENYPDQLSLIKGDSLVPHIMAASILAKTYRDEKMKKLHEKYPLYGFFSKFGI